MPIVTTTGLIPTAAPAATLPPIQWAVAAGTGDAITAAYSTPNTLLTDGLILAFRALFANATAAPTFSPDGLTAHVITRFGGQALLAGDIPGALAEELVRYNLANTRWELLNPVGFSKAPTYQSFTGASTGTYTPSAGTIRSKVRMVGGGASGQAAGGGAFNLGAQSSFGSTTAKGTTNATGGTGGTTVTGTEIIRLQGGTGQPGTIITAAGQQVSGGQGGSSLFGTFPAFGGGGLGSNSAGSSSSSGSGGGAGEYVEFFVISPTAQSYVVGGGGASPGSGGSAGAAGAILVEEFYS